jgi:lysyl-tRNA synthetase class 1
MEPVVPPEIEAVIARFDLSKVPFDEHEVKQALTEARQKLIDLGQAENLGAWAEILAFALIAQRHSPSPWGTFFGPIATGTKGNGEPFYGPDIAGTDPEVIGHWTRRARSLTHPVLKARYADLSWDMSKVLGGVARDPVIARMAIDAYLASVASGQRKDIHDEFEATTRALELAQSLDDEQRVDEARRALLAVHKKAVEGGKGLWWIAFDRLVGNKNTRLTDFERDRLVEDLEGLAVKFSTFTENQNFDPHAAQQVADRLVKHYQKSGRRDDVVRLKGLTGQSFENAASLASPMLAASFLQTAATAYREAGLGGESKRVRVVMEQKISDSKSEMKTITFETTIPKEDIDKFLKTVVVDDIVKTFARIASEFLDRRQKIEESVKKETEESPLSSMITQTIMGDRHVAASIGSVDDDQSGRIIQHAARLIAFGDIWLTATLRHATEVNQLTPHHVMAWIMQSGLFNDPGLLEQGVYSWFEGDFVKAIHVLVPQVEVALRDIAEGLGLPTTKPHPRVQGVSVVVNMGDLLSNKAVTEALGPDITLHLQAIYSDPRGLNLRNEMAHGLTSAEQLDETTANKVIHTLLVLGIWDHLAKARTTSPP